MKNAYVGLAVAVLAALTLSACGSAPEADAQKAEAAEAPVQKGPSSSLSTGDAAAGEKLANTKMGANNQACVECHGPHGNAPNAPDRPKIGGQYRDYIAHALQSYRAGQRTNITMDGQAKDLTDQQISDLAEYFGTQQGELTDLSHLQK
jgi:cytochrome c553